MPEQAKRYETDIWEEADCHLSRHRPQDHAASSCHRQRPELLGQIERLGTRDANRIAAVMTTLGWKRLPRTGDVRPWGRASVPSGVNEAALKDDTEDEMDDAQ